MARKVFPLLLALGFSVGPALAQPTPCAAGAPVASYSVCPIAAGFTSILGDPGAVVIVFAACSDNAVVAAPGPLIPFAFSFFGGAVTSARPSTNGLMKLIGGGGPTDSAANYALPSIVAPNSLVAPFWDDLKTGPAGDPSTIAYLSTPVSMIVEWSNMKFAAAGATGGSPGTGGSVTFQAALFPNGNIEFRYGPYTPPGAIACPPYAADACGAASAFPQSGPSATIGLENGTGTVGVDGTGFGGGNTRPPLHNLRFVPATVTPVTVGYTVTPTGTPAFVSTFGQLGTVALLPNPSFALPGTCPACLDNANWMRQPFGGMASGPGPLAWPFTLFGRTYYNFNLNSNGLLTLGDPMGVDYSLNAIPSSTTFPNAYIAPFWDDLEAKPTSFIAGQVAGLPGGRAFTVEWRDMGLFTGTSGDCAATVNSLSMQAVLSELSDNIELKYDFAAPLGAGFTATSAIESHTGSASVAVLPGDLNAAVPATNVLLDPCDCGTVRYFGTGCPGTAGFVPRIGTTGVAPVLGSTAFGITLTNALGGVFNNFLIGATPTPPGGIPVLPPCSLYGAFFMTGLGGLTTLGGPGQGTRCILIPIPNIPTLSCGSLVMQAAVIDLGSATGLVAASDAIQINIL